jgi:hypothetical protein
VCRWPIYQSIREEFREHASLTDEKKISQQMIAAQQGLAYMR